jgi:hypothetical protein
MVSALFYIGVYLGLSDIVVPVQIGRLIGGRETPKEPLSLTLVEVALMVVVITCAIKLPWRRVKQFGSMFVLLLLVSEFAVIFHGLSTDVGIYPGQTGKISEPPEKLSVNGNIYHITLDAYSSNVLLESLEELELAEETDGFTFFRNNHSNYVFTRVSVPSYMTGSFYESGSLENWTTQHTHSGVMNSLYDAGYEISMYTPWWVNNKATYIKTYEDVLMKNSKSLASVYHFADLWLLRIVPSFFQQEVYQEGRGVFTWLLVKEGGLAALDARPFVSVEVMRALIVDETERPDHGQYVYAHLYIPHNPFVMNRDCAFSPKDGDYGEQALCATRLIAELVSKLKELGRYHEATIIIQSDHGDWNLGPVDYAMSVEAERKITEINPHRLSAKHFVNYTYSLLLVKPPLQSEAPLRISDRPTQLADIPATIYDLQDLSLQTKEGMSVFSADFPETREIHVFAGFMQKDEDKEMHFFGKEILEGEFIHLSFTNGKGWKIYPDIPVRWE